MEDELKITPMLARLNLLAKQLNALSDEFAKPIELRILSSILRSSNEL